MRAGSHPPPSLVPLPPPRHLSSVVCPSIAVPVNVPCPCHSPGGTHCVPGAPSCNAVLLLLSLRPVPDPKAIKAGTLEIWESVKEELYHYKLGSKLLWRDMQTSTQLLKRVFAGNELTRRERQQLLKTSADMFRLVCRGRARSPPPPQHPLPPSPVAPCRTCGCSSAFLCPSRAMERSASLHAHPSTYPALGTDRRYVCLPPPLSATCPRCPSLCSSSCPLWSSPCPSS
jgi:hypothetical protein